MPASGQAEETGGFAREPLARDPREERTELRRTRRILPSHGRAQPAPVRYSNAAPWTFETLLAHRFTAQRAFLCPRGLAPAHGTSQHEKVKRSGALTPGTLITLRHARYQ